MTLKQIPWAKPLQGQIGRLFSRLPFSANQFTVSSVFFAFLGFYFSSMQLALPSLLFFIISGAIDAVDGAVARAKRQVSNRGAYIDGMADRLVEFLFIMSFFFYPLSTFVIPAQLSLILMLFFGSAMTGFATAYAEHRHVADSGKIAAQPGIMPRAERLLLLFAAFALAPIYPILASLLLLAGAVLCFLTFCQRFWYFAE